MDIGIIGFILDTFGKVLLGISVYLVHTRVMREGKIDKTVIKEMKKEKKLIIIGIILILLGFFIQLSVKLS